jgi:hypothetical protein
MSVTQFALFVSDPEPVSRWLAEHCGSHVVRNQARQLKQGWNVKVALDDSSLSEMFRLRWADNLITFDNQRKWLAERKL